MSDHALTKRESQIDSHYFRTICARFACGITVVTVVDEHGCEQGMTASSFTSVSLSPPLILFCVAHGTRMLSHLHRSQYFGVNILKNGQRDLSEHFARGGHKRFAGIDWYYGKTGVPLLPGVLATIECSRANMVAAGDHDILIGEVCHADCGTGDPLIHFGSQYRELGPSPTWTLAQS